MNNSKYIIEVTYAAGNTDTHTGLVEYQAAPGIAAFVDDLFFLKGRGVTKVSIEIEGNHGDTADTEEEPERADRVTA